MNDDIVVDKKFDREKDREELLFEELKVEELKLPKKAVHNILEYIRIIKKRASNIENILREYEKMQYRPSKDMPGIEGVYDGNFMISDDGKKYEVPKNYAAKSLLVVGDRLKKIVEDDKESFKIVEKIARKKIEGLISKKDGRFVLLAKEGTFNLLKNAVDFRNLKQGDTVLAYIPESTPHKDFAALDKLKNPSTVTQIAQTSPKKPEEKRLEPVQVVKKDEVRKETPKEAPKEPAKNQNLSKTLIFDEEDLI
jgi:hypothetical protein